MRQTSSKTKNKSYRNDILKYALEKYETIPDYPWVSLPGYAILRHKDNKKWYGIIMDVPKEKLGLPGQKTIDVLEIKCNPDMIGSLLTMKGFLSAYHMSRGMKLKYWEQYEQSLLPDIPARHKGIIVAPFIEKVDLENFPACRHFSRLFVVKHRWFYHRLVKSFFLRILCK